jgi:SAM-dependent methyltransferase
MRTSKFASQGRFCADGGTGMPNSRTWWNRAACRDVRWYIATTPDPFFERGRRDADELIGFCGLRPAPTKTLLEIGCGIGRMTHRFAELYGQVIALDVADEMLRLGRRTLADRDNVRWVLGSGCDLEGIPDHTVDDVFSYITLQHVPTRAAVLRYLEEVGRVLRPGGHGALQVRHPGLLPWMLDTAGHLLHATRGRPVWSAEWRGRRIPAPLLLEAATRSGARAQLRARGHRHLWVLLRR